jgi:hypothetical protein
MERITIDPDPAKAGKNAKICYDFSGLSLTSVTVKIDYKPDSIPDSEVELTPEAHCATVKIPPGATGGFLIDQSGNSDTLGFLVA